MRQLLTNRERLWGIWCIGIPLKVFVIPLYVGLIEGIVVAVGVLDHVVFLDGIVTHHFAFAIVPVAKLFADNGAVSVDDVGSRRSWCFVDTRSSSSVLLLIRQRLICQVTLLEDDGIQNVVVLLAGAWFRHSMGHKGPELVRPGPPNLESSCVCVAASLLEATPEFQLDVLLKDESIAIRGIPLVIKRHGCDHAITIKGSVHR